MRVQKKNKAFAYRVPIGDYNYLQSSYGYLKRLEGKIRKYLFFYVKEDILK